MRRILIASAVGVAVVLAAVTGIAQLASGRDATLSHATTGTAVAAPVLTLAEIDHKFLADDFTDRISSESYWRSRPSRAPSPPAATARGRSNLQGPPPDSSWFLTPPSSMWTPEPQKGVPVPRASPRTVSGYRTVCVRTCDGFFFPISFGASEGQFSRDQSTCSNACPGARLFYYKASSEDPEDMVDTGGQAYSKLPNANLFRTQYVESCKCKPHPWEQQATEKHRIFALEDQRRKGNRAVVAELDQLKTKSRQEKIGNAERNGRSKRNLRRAPTDQIQNETSKQPSPATTTIALAPRSDASRGQGGPDRTGVQLASSTRTDSRPTEAPGTRENMATDALNGTPSQSPIARAATAAAAGHTLDRPVSGSPVLTQAAIRPDHESARSADPAAPSDIPLQIQPEAMPAPEAIIAIPFEQLPGAAPLIEQRRTSRNDRRNRSARNGQNAGARRSAESSPAPSWQINRTTAWTRNVFQQ